MAKKKKPVVHRQMTRKQQSRAQREARMNRLIVGGTSAVLALVIVILGYGYLSENVFQPRRPVAVVNGVEITTRDLEARQAYFEIAPEYSSYPIQPAQVLNQLVREELIRQEASLLGISIPEEELDRTIETLFGFIRDPGVTEEVTSTGELTATGTITFPQGISEEEFQERFQSYVDQVFEPSGMGVEGYREMIEAYLLEQEVLARLTADVSTAEHVRVRYFAFITEEEANAVVERLDAGEEWEDIAEEIESDDTNETYITELEWKTESYVTQWLGAEVAEAVFAAEIGYYTPPTLGISGRYYVLELLERAELELEGEMLSLEQERIFNEWLDTQMGGVEYLGEWQEAQTDS